MQLILVFFPHWSLMAIRLQSFFSPFETQLFRKGVKILWKWCIDPFVAILECKLVWRQAAGQWYIGSIKSIGEDKHIFCYFYCYESSWQEDNSPRCHWNWHHSKFKIDLGKDYMKRRFVSICASVFATERSFKFCCSPILRLKLAYGSFFSLEHLWGFGGGCCFFCLHYCFSTFRKLDISIYGSVLHAVS